MLLELNESCASERRQNPNRLAGWELQRPLKWTGGDQVSLHIVHLGKKECLWRWRECFQVFMGQKRESMEQQASRDLLSPAISARI